MYIAWMYLKCTYTFVHEDEGQGTKNNSVEYRTGGVHSCTGSILFTTQIACNLFMSDRRSRRAGSLWLLSLPLSRGEIVVDFDFLALF